MREKKRKLASLFYKIEYKIEYKMYQQTNRKTNQKQQLQKKKLSPTIILWWFGFGWRERMLGII